MSAGANTFKGDPRVQKEVLSGTAKDRQERGRLYLVLGAMGVSIVGLGVAVASLASNHEVVPIVVALDANGHVARQQVVTPETVAANESVLQSNVHDFVVACNTFDPAWRDHYADLCRVRSTPTVAEQYSLMISPENPQSPYLEVGEKGRRYPEVVAINKLEGNAYQVAFKSILEKPGTKPDVSYYTALVRYAHTLKPLKVGDRWENPLGFVATAYRKDQELSRSK